MSLTLAWWFVLSLGIYLATGLVFALPFVLWGVNRIDPVARGSSWGFRLIILPGVIACWPLLLQRWIGGHPRPVERNAHRQAARRGAAK